jgi:hypothetical protein
MNLGSSGQSLRSAQTAEILPLLRGKVAALGAPLFSGSAR